MIVVFSLRCSPSRRKITSSSTPSELYSTSNSPPYVSIIQLTVTDTCRFSESESTENRPAAELSNSSWFGNFQKTLCTLLSDIAVAKLRWTMGGCCSSPSKCRSVLSVYIYETFLPLRVSPLVSKRKMNTYKFKENLTNARFVRIWLVEVGF